MNGPVRILAFAGSTREGSYNRALIRQAAAFAGEAGAAVNLIDLDDFPMPIVNQDLELSHGIPLNSLAFKRLLFESDGFLIASPEYNGFVTPLLKNCLDWASRSETPDEKPLSAFRKKTAAILSASPGSLGGLRSLSALRTLLTNLGVIVIPGQHAVSGADKAIDGEGMLTDPGNVASVKRVVRELVRITSALKAGVH
ncbi:MAG: NAD(P)H-dependent oxidoreductase [Candidatus Fermentibacteraceae bacterium]